VGRQHAQQAAVLIGQWRGLDGLEAAVGRDLPVRGEAWSSRTSAMTTWARSRAARPHAELSSLTTSKTTPTSAIRLCPAFSPLPSRLPKVFTRIPPRPRRRRSASGRIAAPLPSADSASPPGPGAGGPAG
jgi:hypothetical protein